MHCHDSWILESQGAHYNTDTTNYENMHIVCVKNNYSSSSRRYDNLYSEMARNIQSSRLVRSIPETCIDDNEEIIMHKRARTTMITYETVSNVVYEAPVTSAFQEELFYANGCLQTSNKRIATFLNPMTTLADLLKSLRNSESRTVQAFMLRFEQHEIGFNIFLHKHFKLDASCYGIPLCFLNCFSKTQGSSQFRFRIFNYYLELGQHSI